MTSLRDYPKIGDFILDYEVSKIWPGKVVSTYDISKFQLENGRVVVCLHQLRETGEIINGKRRCEQGVVIHGYEVKPTGLINFWRESKVELVPKDDATIVGRELFEHFARHNFVPDYIELSSI